MNDRDEELRGLDAVLRELRHARYGLYGPLVRERFLDGLPAEVTPTGYRVLRFVEASSPPPPTVSDIAALLLSDRARAVRVVDRLTAAGLVTRVRDTVDRRIRRVDLTDAGRRHIALAAARRTRLLGEATADWPDEDLARLTDFLERLNASVARHLPGADASDVSGAADVHNVSDATDVPDGR
ncbi:MarR family winged helix-turn-helix transcriptional regulator [Streptomyces malaysiensis]|uniref:MarR family winged helix-turn-helix transcriptional regulator n=1 Tax=Streptomyces malaysiensis TaxID=92644 RepID=UPI002B28AB81|nr:MarR family winged helix-turn-helix transcriptional regulator [Streptomyces malaysiensis]